MMEAIEQTQEAELGYLRKLLKDMMTFEKYVAYKSKTDFFLDTRSDQTDKITKALCEFMLQMPKMKTDKTINIQGRSYNYQSFPCMLECISIPLAKNALKVGQDLFSMENKTYIVTKICHASGQYFRTVTALPEEYMQAGKVVSINKNLQALGGAHTYIKRYALKSILGIDADDDTDGGAAVGANTYSGANTQTQRTSYGK